jgi:hypothetical protein
MLCCKEGVDKGRRWRYSVEETTSIVIGRLRGCHLLLHDPKVSQSHCLLQIQKKSLSVVDMGSHGGTFVNGQAVVRVRELAEGDLLSLGNSSLSLTMETEPDAAAKRCSPTAKKKQDVPISTIEPPKVASTAKENRDSTSDTLVMPQDISQGKSAFLAACMFCGCETDSMRAEDVTSCPACETIADLWRNSMTEWQITGAPWYNNRYGIIVPASKDKSRNLIYITRRPQPQLRLSWLEEAEDCSHAHPYIYPLNSYRACQDYLVAELPYYPGIFLDKLKTPLTVLEAIAIILQIGKALAYGHSRWGAHGEICPHNIYQEASGKPYLVGYGLVRNRHFPEERWHTRDHLDAVYFAAPEVLAGETSQAAADIFALAASLFTLLTGSLIYQGETWAELQREAGDFAPTLERFRHPWLRNFFAVALARQPDSRHSDIAHFVDSLALVYSACRGQKQEMLVAEESAF